MRLLRTDTFKFYETNRPGTLSYAILSHTWGNEEVSLQQMHKAESKELEGYKKIESCCIQARSDGFDYVWIDTCCIDKTNNAELSEAINSMYNWYQRSAKCYVYLNDYSAPAALIAPHHDWKRCRWFSRGWTLQELLASEHIAFFDRDWKWIGDPSTDSSLAERISQRTGIQREYIEQRGSTVRRASVATRMSWAAGRQTTRTEDQAYSLMGLFDVNMPLLYGEGPKAFIRLQQEIARISDDESLFAWHDSLTQSGVFAPSLSAFAGCADFHPYPEAVHPRPPYSITNRGLSINATYQVLSWESLHGHSRFKDQASSEYIILPFNCSRQGDPDRPFTIILRAVSRDVYVRWLPGEVMVSEKYSLPTLPYQRKTVYIQDPKESMNECGDESCISVYSKPFGTFTPFLSSSWYITPPGFSEINDRGHWTIWFGGWTGFAVTCFREMWDKTLVIVLKHVVTQPQTESGATHTVTLEVYSGQGSQCPTVADIVDRCYARKDLLNVVATDPVIGQVSYSKYGTLVLSPRPDRVYPYGYDLELRPWSSEPPIPS